MDIEKRRILVDQELGIKERLERRQKWIDCKKKKDFDEFECEVCKYTIFYGKNNWSCELCNAIYCQCCAEEYLRSDSELEESNNSGESNNYYENVCKKCIK